jgi:hypothetical protein
MDDGYIKLGESIINFALKDLETGTGKNFSSADQFFKSGEFRLYASLAGLDHECVLKEAEKARGSGFQMELF